MRKWTLLIITIAAFTNGLLVATPAWEELGLKCMQSGGGSRRSRPAHVARRTWSEPTTLGP